MKTITFFSEKGGVGKSSMAIMYASWLKQKFGINVAVADFNGRIGGYRREEMAERERLITKNPELGLEPFDPAQTWPLIECKISEIRKIQKDTYSEFPYNNWFTKEIEDGRLKGYDIVICDFPGSLSGGEFNQLFYMKQLGLIVIPIENDQMTIQSTIRLINSIGNQQWANYCAFMNKAQLELLNLKSKYRSLMKALIETGLPMLPDMISFSSRMTSMSKVDNIRSTFGFPNFESKEFGSQKDLGIENLFIDVTKLLSKTTDLSGTEILNMDFASSLNKQDDELRQFSPSAFPELDM